MGWVSGKMGGYTGAMDAADKDVGGERAGTLPREVPAAEEVAVPGEGEVAGGATNWVDPDPPPVPDRIRNKRFRPELQRVRAAAPRHRLRAARRQLAAHRYSILAGLVLVLLGGWLLWPAAAFDDAARQRWEELCHEYGGWFGPFADRLTDNDRLALRELGLESVLKDIEAARSTYDPRIIAGLIPAGNGPRDPLTSPEQLAENPPRPARQRAGITQTQHGLATLERVHRGLARWPVALTLAEHAEALEARGWAVPAATIRHALADRPPDDGSVRAPGEALRRMAELEPMTGQIVALLDRLESDLAVLEDVDDPVLATLGRSVAAVHEAARVSGAPMPLEKVEQLYAQLQPLEAFGRRLRAAVEDAEFARLDRASFREAGGAYALLAEQGGASAEVYRLWLDEWPGYRHGGEDWREAWAAAKRAALRTVGERLARLREAEHPSAKPLGTKWHRLDEQIADVLDAPWVMGSAARLDVDRRTIDRELEDLETTSMQMQRQAQAEASW